jgi:hypothetical protein
MKITIKSLAVIVTAILLLSFTNKNSNNFIGTYGVSESDPSEIKLIINSDHTFNYHDYSNPNKKISVSGTWTLKGKKVLLVNSNSEKKFHTVWTFAKNGQVAKSHMGLLFYRLCKIDQ